MKIVEEDIGTDLRAIRDVVKEAIGATLAPILNRTVSMEVALNRLQQQPNDIAYAFRMLDVRCSQIEVMYKVILERLDKLELLIVEIPEVREAQEKLDKYEFLLNTPVEDLELSNRCRNALIRDCEYRNGKTIRRYRTIRNLIAETKQSLSRTPNFGPKSLKEIIKCLDSMGLKLSAQD